MKLKIVVLIYLLTSFIFLMNAVEYISKIPSTVKGIDIPNTHVVYEDGKGAMILRGNSVRSKLLSSDIDELLNFGVKEVLAFKVDTDGNVKKEMEVLKAKGLAEDKIHYIPFEWKKAVAFEEACKQTVDALKILKNAVDKKTKLFFHCSVGEDRTGYLAGLFELGLDPKKDIFSIFKKEMCERGYSDSNKEKPLWIIETLEKNMTPLFIKMVYKIQKGELKLKKLSSETCKTEPTDKDILKLNPKYNLEHFRCRL
jgi:hypothetical protein